MKEEIKSIIENISLEQKIAQLFVIAPEQLPGEVTSAEDMKNKLEAYPVGGFIYFSYHILNPVQTTEMLATTCKIVTEVEGVPPFLCVDEEGGDTSRIAINKEFDVEVIGPMADVESASEAYRCGDVIGRYLKELGFNVDFAPVADVITNSSNVIIGNRSFGTDADTVTEYSVAYSNGLHKNEILSTFKHFPGHGATEADTHAGYAYTNKSYDELKLEELKPFAVAKDNNVDMIMVAHISVPNVIGDDTPCTLSKKMVTDILRNDLAYDGLVVTDGLNMGAIANIYSPSEAAIAAIQAGIDLLLLPADFVAAYEGVLEAVKRGIITEERIDESLERIMRVKGKL